MEVKDITIKDIKFRENIRLAKDDTSAELMSSIKQTGLLQPVGVFKEDGNYFMIWGHRRLHACKNLGWKTIPAVIFSEEDNMTEEEFLVINSIENLQKKPNTLFELGRIANILRKTMSISEIASKLSMPKSRIGNSLVEFKRIPKRWHKRIKLFGSNEEKKGDIPMETASRIGRVRGLDMKQRDELMELVSKNDISQAELVMISSLMKAGKTAKEAYNSWSSFKVVSFKFGIDKAKHYKIMEDLNVKSFGDFVIDAINSKVPNLVFKIAQKDASQK